MSDKKITVVELFAGVGGFRLAATRASNVFDFIWANQWEPKRNVQHAFDCYNRNFGNSENHVCEDITKAKEKIPANFDLLVGGFPCQDYSVANKSAKGIRGAKGVLWWEINWILQNKKPRLVLLENVDRLLKSPTSQRGRDFAIMLKCFNDAGYNVEWRMINAAEYGFTQRRKRVFIFASLKSISDKIYNFKKENRENIYKDSFLNSIFPIVTISNKIFFDLNKNKNLWKLSDNYDNGKFNNFGIMLNGKINHNAYEPLIKNDKLVLRDIIQKRGDFNYLDGDILQKIKSLKDRKKIKRYRPDGILYYYSEGQMNLVDELNKPSRTMLTSEASVNRSTHIIKNKHGHRFLTPIECERLNGFDDDWTRGMTDRMRYFCMGNALVVGVVEKIMKKISNLDL